MARRLAGQNGFANAVPWQLPSRRVFQSEQHHDNDVAFIRMMDERRASD
jgi:hypothetical protein